jgi:hypothetical protein
MRPRTLPHTGGSRRPRDAPEHLRGTLPGGAPADTGRAAACPVRLFAGPPSPGGVCGWVCPDGHRRGPFLRALQRGPSGTRLSPGHPGLGTRRPRAASSPPTYYGVGPDAAPVARLAAQGHPSGVRLGPYALAGCPAGPDAAGPAGSRGFGRDQAALAPRARRGGVGKRANLGAQGDAPHRGERLARLRFV